MQTQRARAAERQEPAAQEAAAGLHGPPAPHPDRHLQGEQAPIQGDADDHLAAAGLGAQHRQQLLHECPPALHEPLAGGARCQPWSPLFFYKHFLQSMMSPSPPCPFLDILLMTKPTPDSHACPEPTRVGAFGCCRSISLPNPQPGITPGHRPHATSCCHVLPAHGAGKGFATRSAPYLGGLEENLCGTRNDLGWRERARCCLDASLVLEDHRTLSSPTHQGHWGEGHVLILAKPQSVPQPPLWLSWWRGKGGGDTRSGVMGLDSGTTPLNQGESPLGSQGNVQGKCSP